MRISENGIKLIKEFEGFSYRSYEDLADVWTIGYGTTVYPTGRRVGPKDTCTEEEADLWLRYHIAYKIEKWLNMWIKQPINQNQYDAFVSLAYNIGIEAFHKSTLLTYFNRTGMIDKDHLTRWNKVTTPLGKMEVSGLKKRREREWELYNGNQPINA